MVPAKFLVENPPIVAQIEKDVSEGMPVSHAIALHGIQHRTFMQWMAKGREYIKALEDGDMLEADINEGYAVCIRLVNAINKAKAEAVKKNIVKINKASEDPKHWTAAAWYLERTDRENFGKSAQVEIKGHMGVSNVELSPEDEAKFRESLGELFITDED